MTPAVAPSVSLLPGDRDVPVSAGVAAGALAAPWLPGSAEAVAINEGGDAGGTSSRQGPMGSG